jgi:carbamoyl-phosphate synthase large subunit
MSTSLRVLVTASGGDFGQALTKALRLSPSVAACFGCDSDASGIGAAFVDGFAVAPRADAGHYVGALESLCRQWSIDAVLPGSEAEMVRLNGSGEPPALPSGVPLVCQPAEWFTQFADKLRCMEALAAAVPLAPFADGGDDEAVRRLVEESGFPLVVKPRRSSGSRRLSVVNDVESLGRARRDTADSIVQAYIDDRDGEWSVGVFRADGDSRAVAFRRALGAVGCSWFAEVIEDREVLDYAHAVAAATNLHGSANVQVRKSSRGVRLLEINARFSSLVAARAFCGFNDVEWSLAQRLGQPVPPMGPIRPIRFRRFFHELIDDGYGFEAVTEWLPRSRPAVAPNA